MKKLIIASACVLAIAGSAFAQGNVNWNVLSAAGYTSQSNSTVYSTFSPANAGQSISGGAVGATGGSAFLGTGYYYELLIGSVNNSGVLPSAPTTLAGLSGWADSGLEATNSNTAGRITPINGNAGATVSQMSATSSNNIILVGWSANLGTTWSAALGNLTTGSGWTGTAFFGVSNVGDLEALSTSTSPGSTVFANSATAQGIPIFSLNTQLNEIAPVPEPATMALAALGGASLLLFRRRK